LKKTRQDKVRNLDLNPGKKSKAEILVGLKKVGKLYTADSCGKIWKESRRSAGTHPFAAELIPADLSKLYQAQKRIGELYADAVWNVMHSWIGFIKHAEHHGGAFKSPMTPSIPYFIKYVEHAATFKVAKKIEDFSVKLIAKESKPLTKPNVKPHTKHEAATLEEILAIGAQFKL
jgi:hypothetical protein